MARLKTAATPVPQTTHSFECLAAELAATLREIDRINSDLADQITTLKLAAKAKSDPMEKAVSSMWKAFAAYAEAHRKDLLPPGRKNVAIAAGLLGWRLSNPKVVLTAPEEEVIAALEEAGLVDALREVVEIDKTVLLGRREIVESIPGVTIHQEVRLFFQPLDLSTEKTKASLASLEEAA